jgi:hypothetical protein
MSTAITAFDSATPPASHSFNRQKAFIFSCHYEAITMTPPFSLFSEIFSFIVFIAGLNRYFRDTFRSLRRHATPPGASHTMASFQSAGHAFRLPPAEEGHTLLVAAGISRRQLLHAEIIADTPPTVSRH